MGLFDMFMSEDRKIQKHQRQVTNRDLQPEDRYASVKWLHANGSAKAITALVTRFDMKLENHLNDKDEKDHVYSLVLGLGKDAVRPLKHHLRKCKQFALPIRLYAELEGEEAAVELVYELLEHEYEKDDFKPEKKVSMLVWLAGRKHQGAIEHAASFLKDFDEGVRYAAVEVLIAQLDESARPHLYGALVNREDDSNRVRSRVTEVFAQRRWSVDDPEAVASLLPEGYQVKGGVIVAV